MTASGFQGLVEGIKVHDLEVFVAQGEQKPTLMMLCAPMSGQSHCITSKTRRKAAKPSEIKLLTK